MRPVPAYIQESGVFDLPPNFPWKGKGMHYGPEQGTKLHSALEKLTTCGNATVAALVVEWIAWRFHKVINVENHFCYVDATLAWLIDSRYRSEKKIQTLILTDTPTNQAIGDAIRLLHRVTEDSIWTYPVVNVPSCASLVSVTKQTLPDKQKKALTAWLDVVIPRAAKADPAPRKAPPDEDDFDTDEEYQAALRPVFGHPLPREALDPEAGYKPEQREELLSRFLGGLDWKKNPFLNSPEEMKKLGFKGKPYEL
jgi:hypothetical protein